MPTDIRNFLLVLTAGVVAAFLLAFVMVRYYSPTGKYLAESVLVSPEMLYRMGQGEGGSYSLDRIEYRHFNSSSGRWETIDVSETLWGNFYALVHGDESPVQVEPELISQFHQQKLPHLTVWVRRDGSTGGEQTLQRIDFVPQVGLYRVELLGDAKDTEGWAYFRHTAIAQRVHELILRGPQT